MLSRTQVYNHLYHEVKMREALKVHPDSPKNFLEIASRKAHIHAIQNTWFWFNNQDSFLKNCFYPIKS